MRGTEEQTWPKQGGIPPRPRHPETVLDLQEEESADIRPL